MATGSVLESRQELDPWRTDAPPTVRAGAGLSGGGAGPLALVVAAALAVVSVSYWNFLQVEEALWYTPTMDHNAHLRNGMVMAQHLRAGNLVGALHEIHGH